MSDSYISIVPKIKEYPGNKQKAKEILNWLIEQDIVKSELTDSVLGSPLGYSVSNGAKKIVDEPEYLPFDLWTNGLDVITENQVFDPGEFFDEEGDVSSLPESNLGFIFWNWPPFAQTFIEQFKIKLGCDVEVIIGRI
jgi:hypothetical protein